MQAIQKKTNEFWVPLRDGHKNNPKELERLTLLKVEELCQIGTKKNARLLNYFVKVGIISVFCQMLQTVHFFCMFLKVNWKL